MREQVASLDRYTDEPIIGARLTLRAGPGGPRERYVADALSCSMAASWPPTWAGRIPREATEAAVERLRRQLRRVVGADVARRNEPDEIRKAIADLAAAESPRTGPRRT